MGVEGRVSGCLGRLVWRWSYELVCYIFFFGNERGKDEIEHLPFYIAYHCMYVNFNIRHEEGRCRDTNNQKN